MQLDLKGTYWQRELVQIIKQPADYVNIVKKCTSMHPCERTTVTLAVQVPVTATVGMSSTATVTLWPHHDATRRVTLRAVTTVAAPQHHLPFVVRQE